MEYMVVWLHHFADTYYSVHGFDQQDDAKAFYQELATNNPNIFSCLGEVEVVEQQFASSAIFDGLPRPSKARASGTEEDSSVDRVKTRLIQGQTTGEIVCMAIWLLGRGSFYRIREFDHVEDAVSFFRGFSEAGLHSPTYRDMFMCVVKFKVLQLRNVAAKGHNA
jgi:uncharacterized protein YsxB (DUF464 family)